MLEDLQFANDVQFQQGADGAGEMVGQFVSETGQVRGAGRMAGGRMMGPKVRGELMLISGRFGWSRQECWMFLIALSKRWVIVW